jgi:hypothetical protein
MAASPTLLLALTLTTSSGFHGSIRVSGVALKYAHVGDHSKCLSCGAGILGNSPNNNPGADAMATTLAHEINEAITDPVDGGGWWFDSNGDENAVSPFEPMGVRMFGTEKVCLVAQCVKCAVCGCKVAHGNNERECF